MLGKSICRHCQLKMGTYNSLRGYLRKMIIELEINYFPPKKMAIFCALASVIKMNFFVLTSKISERINSGFGGAIGKLGV